MGISNMISELLKFGTYSRAEQELQATADSSQTTLPQQEETSYVSYDPFNSSSSNQMGQQNIMGANNNEMIRKWRESSFLPEVDTAITEISNEAISYDEIEETIQMDLSDLELPDEIKEKMMDSFDHLLYLLDFAEKGDELFKQWYVDGQLNIEACYDNTRMREGIKKLVLMTPYNLQSYIEPNTKTKKYYYGEINANTTSYRVLKPELVFQEEQVVHIDSGIWSMGRKFPISNINKAMKSISQLNLIEDSLVIYRITRSPEKLAFYIATGKLPKAKAEEYMNSMISKYRQKRVYNTESGTLENKNRSISILENYWFPLSETGNSSRVETVAGQSPNFTSFEDVDYFINKVYKALHIPQNRRAADSRMTLNNSVDIEKEEVRFFKFIMKLRKRFNNLFLDLLKKDLLAKRVLDLEDWQVVQEKIKFVYANSNEYSEIKNNQVMGMRVDAANGAMGLVDTGLLSVPFIQEKILRLTEEERNQIEIDNGTKKDREDMADSEFGDDYDVRKRDTGMGSSSDLSGIPDVPDVPKPSGGSAIPEPTNPTTPNSPAKPMSPTTGGAESKINSIGNMLNGNMLNENILSSLQEGDLLTNGTKSFKFTNGKLIEC